ncbi:MAG: LuxR family transcriptional regulator [Maricaulaceae bacterium]
MSKIEDRIENTITIIQAINSAVTLDDMFDHLVAYGKSLEFETISIAPLINPVLMNIDISTIGRSTWPVEFLEKWIAKNYIIHDPVSQRALVSQTPLLWQESYKTASKKGQRILDEGAEYGLENGISIPVHLPQRPPGSIAFSGGSCDFSPDETGEIQLVCTHAYSNLMTLAKFEDKINIPTLTHRESDILHYVAAGKTNWEIAKIYGLSEHSVKSYMKNISIKFGATNRAHAVTLGIMSGQILL